MRTPRTTARAAGLSWTSIGTLAGTSDDAAPLRLCDVDLLWLVGGNAFTVARAATVPEPVQTFCRTPHITYAGYSASARTTSSDLAGIDLMNPADELSEGHSGDMSAATLDLVGTRVVPYAGTPDAAERHLKAADLPSAVLSDGDDPILTG